MSEHSAGPWIVAPPFSEYGQTVETVDGLVIAQVEYNVHANAHLIAAAPDLLFALEGLYRMWKDAGFDLDFPELIAAQDAISVARGEAVRP